MSKSRPELYGICEAVWLAARSETVPLDGRGLIDVRKAKEEDLERRRNLSAPSATLPKVPRVSLAVEVKELRAEGWGSRDAVIQLAEAYLALSDGGADK